MWSPADGGCSKTRFWAKGLGLQDPEPQTHVSSFIATLLPGMGIETAILDSQHGIHLLGRVRG